MMADEERGVIHQVQAYRKLVLLYEALDQEIDELIMSYGGVPEKMSPEDLQRYRNLARRRDEVQNEMRVMEQQLQLDEDV
jgi:hypothetical protein